MLLEVQQCCDAASPVRPSVEIPPVELAAGASVFGVARRPFNDRLGGASASCESPEATGSPGKLAALVPRDVAKRTGVSRRAGVELLLCEVASAATIWSSV